MINTRFNCPYINLHPANNVKFTMILDGKIHISELAIKVLNIDDLTKYTIIPNRDLFRCFGLIVIDTDIVNWNTLIFKVKYFGNDDFIPFKIVHDMKSVNINILTYFKIAYAYSCGFERLQGMD